MKTLVSAAFALLMIITLSRPTFAQKINKKLAAQLKEIYKDDQQYREAAIAAAKKYGAYSKQDNNLMHKQDSADIINLEKVEKIVAEHGYPGKSMVGDQSKVVFMVVQHNDLAAQEKYLPMFMKAADDGELDRTLLPLMIDRVRKDKGQLQLYGTQLHENKNGTVQIIPIEDEANVNVRRKAAGLPPLEEYYKAWGIHYAVPTAAGNHNPADLYFRRESIAESPVEAIGGDKSIFAKTVYPEKAKANNITGSVLIGYTVDKDGNTKNIEVVKGLGYGCDEEAIRVIKETKYTNKTGEEVELRMKIPFPYKKS